MRAKLSRRFDAPFADRLHLGAEQRDAGLEGLEQVVVVMRLAVVGDDLLRLFALGLGHACILEAARRAARQTASTRLE